MCIRDRYNGIAVYNKRVAYAEQLPKVIDEACRAAVSKKGPAVVEIPVNFGFQEIDENSYYGSGSYERSFIAPALNEVEIDKAVEILNNAERPVIYAGYGGVKAVSYTHLDVYKRQALGSFGQTGDSGRSQWSSDF